MLIAESLPLALQWLIGVILFIGACLGGYWLARGRRAAANQSLADSAVNSLTGELAASNSRIDRLEADKRHLEELNIQKDRLIEQHGARIKNLENLVTARDLIEALDDKVERGFLALNVPIEKLRI